VTSREHQRFKGLPDPGGMAIVYAIESLDGTRGSSADAFGVSSTPSWASSCRTCRFGGPASQALPPCAP